MNMTGNSLRIYVEESTFRAESPSPVALHPFYSTYLLWWLKQEQIRNTHLFVNNPQQANVIFSRGSEFHREELKANIIFVTDGFAGKVKSPYSVVFNFSKLDIDAPLVVSDYAPFSYSPLIDLSASVQTKPSNFSLCVFAPTMKEIQEIFLFWRSRPQIQGTIYAFCLHREMEDHRILSIIEQFNHNNPTKIIRPYYLGQVSSFTIASALNYSRFSLCMIDNSVYPFWSMRTGCYPIVRKSSPASSHVPYVSYEQGFLDIIEYYWNNSTELLRKAETVRKYIPPPFDLGYLLYPLQGIT